MRLLQLFEAIDAGAVGDIQEELRQRYGIHLDLRMGKSGIVDLEGIQAPKDAKPGTGTAAMEDLVRWADQNGIMLTLSFGEKGYEPVKGWKKTTSKGRLEKFYRRFDFKPNKGRYKRYDLSLYTSMYREPVKSTQQKAVDKVRFEGDIVDSRGGEQFGNVIAYLGKKAIGGIKFSDYDGVGYVNWIQIHPDYQRRGIGTKMVQYLKQYLGGQPIKFTSTTPDGTEMGDHLRKQGIIEAWRDETTIPNIDEIFDNPGYFRRAKRKQAERVHMSPDEYIQKALEGFNKIHKDQGLPPTTMEELIASRDPNLVDEYAAAMERGDKFPMLSLDYTGGYFNQEGIHRALAAKKLGLDSVPVTIVTPVTEAQIHPSQLVNVNTPQFKAWFGNSKTVDDQGHPLVFFRGTAKVPAAKGFGSRKSAPSFVANADIASVYAASYGPFGGPPHYQTGATVSPVFLSIQNPVDLSPYEETIDLEHLFDVIKGTDWANPDDMAYIYRILNALRIFEDKGIQFKYELPNLYLGSMDWQELIQKLNKYEDEENYEELSSLLALTEVDVYAIVDTKGFKEWAMSKGYDGVVHYDVFEVGAKHAPSLIGRAPTGISEEMTHLTWRPFSPAQVKSIFNVGTWSPEAPSMSESDWTGGTGDMRKDALLRLAMYQRQKAAQSAEADKDGLQLTENPTPQQLMKIVRQSQKGVIGGTSRPEVHVKGLLDPTSGVFYIWQPSFGIHGDLEEMLMDRGIEPDMEDWAEWMEYDAVEAEEMWETGFIPYSGDVHDDGVLYHWMASEKALRHPSVLRAIKGTGQILKPRR